MMIKMKVDEFIKISKTDLIGKVIVFPTDTVYGVGAMADDDIAVQRIYELKNRNKDKPLAFLAANNQDILPYVNITYPKTNRLMEYWPGALTLVFQKKEGVLNNHKFSTIGFRIPNSSVAFKVLNHLGVMAVTSMNLSGEEPLNDISTIEENFKEVIDYLIVDSENSSQISSTVLDISTGTMKILRQGDLLSKINV